MVTLNPKEMFLANEDQSKEFNTLAHSHTVQVALALAMTHFLQSNPTAEEVRGVNRFIPFFLNIGQRDEAPTVTPYKSIASSIPKREQPPTPKK